MGNLFYPIEGPIKINYFCYVHSSPFNPIKKNVLTNEIWLSNIFEP